MKICPECGVGHGGSKLSKPHECNAQPAAETPEVTPPNTDSDDAEFVEIVEG